MGAILIVSDNNITDQQKSSAQRIVGSDAAVGVVSLEALQVTDARFVDAAFNTEGELTSVGGYRLQVSIVVGKNADGTNHSARGYITLDKNQCPASLKDYAFYMEGVQSGTKVVNPRHVFTKMNNRLVTESGRKWYGMRPLGGSFVFLLGDSTQVEIDGQVRTRTPIDSCTIVGMPEFGRTSGEITLAETTVISSWDDLGTTEPDGLDDF